jgi:hypothetical protein
MTTEQSALINRVCTSCKTVQCLINFSMLHRGKFGRAARCRSCSKTWRVFYTRNRDYDSDKVDDNTKRVCKFCEVEFPITSFSICRFYKSGRFNACKVCERTRARARLIAHRLRKKLLAIDEESYQSQHIPDPLYDRSFEYPTAARIAPVSMTTGVCIGPGAVVCSV